MSNRREYEMTEEELQSIMDASQPTPAMYLSGGQPMFDSPQESANRAWKAIGDRLGFAHLTARPVDGRPMTVFSAIPKETP